MVKPNKKKKNHKVRIEPPSSAAMPKPFFGNGNTPDFYQQNLQQNNSLPAGGYDSQSALNQTPQGAAISNSTFEENKDSSI